MRTPWIAFIVVSSFVLACAEQTPTSSTSAGVPGSSTGTQRQNLQALRPVVGGQLSLSADSSQVLVADAENDRLRVFDVNGGLKFEVDLPERSWPTRTLATRDGVFVVLRATGELALVHPATATTATQVSRVAVCPEPRALTAGAELGSIIVACAGGEVVHVAGGAVTARTATNVEWRDLALQPDGELLGSSFRSAELVTLRNGAVTRVKAAPQRVTNNPLDPVLHVPQVAWRMLPSTGGRTFLVQQLHADVIHVDTPAPGQPPMPGPLPASSSAYGGSAQPPSTGPGLPPPSSCNSSVVVTGITTITSGNVTSVQHTNDVLPVDAALSPDGSMLAVASAGGTGLSIYPTALVDRTSGCLVPTSGLTGVSLTSVVWVSNTKLVVLESLRSTPMLFDLSTGTSRMLGNEGDRSSPAHTLFHQAPRGGAPLACASCHPEGGEDGHVWNIDGKLRRTQSLSGGVMERMPFHWKGDLSTLGGLMADTFEKRMGGAPVPSDVQSELGLWLDTIPAPKSSVVLAADAQTAGLEAFTKAGCTSCHLNHGHAEGPASDVGTGEVVRAPNLEGLQARAPYLHTGEIPDIRARVMGNLHSTHGFLNRLDATEKEALISYLQSL